MKIKRVLVTGGAGCIGYQVCKLLEKKKVKVVLFDVPEKIQKIGINESKYLSFFNGSIMDKVSLEEAVKNCDAVVHLAAYLGVQRTEQNKSRCIEINISGTKNVIDVLNKNKNVKKIIFASSSEVYGEPKSNPVSEKDITQGKTVYAITKLAGEEIIKANYELNKVKYVILRFFNTFGPYQVTQFVIPKFISLIRKNKSPIINGNGKQTRSFTYSKDSARATVDCLFSHKVNNKTINIGNNKSKISIMNLSKMISKLMNKDIKPKVNLNFKKSDRKKSREIYNRICDVSLAKKLLNFKPKYSMKEAILETIKENKNFENW
jgi:UDP-glucose 4-epimerase